jgi:hypothetical protein
VTRHRLDGGARTLRLVPFTIAALACANIESPPGGPPDQAPPLLLRTVPESLGVYPDFDGSVEFHFNEVVAEGSSPNLGFGTGTLEGLIVLSPGEGVPRVDWKRDKVGVRPREGWKRDRVYRIELLPGITDIDRNRSEARTTLTFATGGLPPTDTLRGTVIDWVRGAPARGALLLATLLPDSLTYRTYTDSAGRFVFGPLRRGEYLVHGVIDQNNNARMDSRESFDSVRVAAGTSEAGTMWTFPHDTTGPRLTQTSPSDSLTVVLTFSQSLDPYQRADSSLVRVVLLPDSIPVAVASLLPQAEHDSLYPRVSRADSLAADSTAMDSTALDTLAVDTTRRDSVPAVDSLPILDPGAVSPFDGPPPVQVPGAIAPVDSGVQAILDERPRLFDRLYLRLVDPLEPEGRYFVEFVGIRNVNGVAGDGGAGFVVPLPPPPPPIPEPETPADSLDVGSDNLEAPADSSAGVEPAPAEDVEP